MPRRATYASKDAHWLLSRRRFVHQSAPTQHRCRLRTPTLPLGLVLVDALGKAAGYNRSGDENDGTSANRWRPARAARATSVLVSRAASPSDCMTIFAVAARDQRFRDRYFDIIRAVDSAREKFGEAEAAPTPEVPPVEGEVRAHGFACVLRRHGEVAATVRKWLVTDMLPETGTVLIAGQWGTYKTFLAMDLAAAVMAGDQIVTSAIVQRRGVLLLATEGQNEVEVRLTAAWRAHGGSAYAPFLWTDRSPRLLDRAKAGKILVSVIRAADAKLKKDFDSSMARWSFFSLAMMLLRPNFAIGSCPVRIK
jgi:hypothetical protein